MIKLLVILLVLSPNVVSAADYVIDAFGIVPAEGLSAARAAWSGLQTEGEAQRVVRAGDPFAVLVFAGPKSLVAGKDEGHAVALILDDRGNPVADDIVADFSLGESERRATATASGLVDILFEPSPIARTLGVGVEVGRIQSPRALVRVTADQSTMRPRIEGPQAAVPVEALALLTTNRLTDRFGNPVEDGVSTAWTLRHEDGSWTVLTGTTLNEAAEVSLLTRDISTDAQTMVAIAANSSAATQVRIESASAAFDPELRVWPADDLNAIWVRVGPVTTNAGYLLIDGANVTIEVSTAARQSVSQSGWLRDGYFQTMVPISAGEGPFSVTLDTVLGTEELRADVGESPADIRGVE